MTHLSSNVEKVSIQLREFDENFKKINLTIADDLCRREYLERLCVKNSDTIEILSGFMKMIEPTIQAHEKLHREYSEQIYGIKDFITKEISILREQTFKEILGLKEINIAQINVKKGFMQATGIVPKAIALLLSIAAGFYAYDDHRVKNYDRELRAEQQRFEHERIIRLDEEKEKRYMISKGVYER
ncbi:hypothetical protein UFOVP1361_3 [uncultured Caudovirales phage]|uniref:Uncharacterized protein n=1 Tax=uncultured Caudovirales phage TaxID=2100421 RepID=A0A6J5S2L2_9CAUD|nr:hypothetical protein UFOVP1361_3 [uncultured Caudovirales phage]